MNSINFALIVNKVPYSVNATPFHFNTETRFRVSYNNSPEFIFALDPRINQLTAIDLDASIIPDPVETAIAYKLRSVRV